MSATIHIVDVVGYEFDAILNGSKSYRRHKATKRFAVGDVLRLREFHGACRVVFADVTWVEDIPGGFMITAFRLRAAEMKT